MKTVKVVHASYAAAYRAMKCDHRARLVARAYNFFVMLLMGQPVSGWTLVGNIMICDKNGRRVIINDTTALKAYAQANQIEAEYAAKLAARKAAEIAAREAAEKAEAKAKAEAEKKAAQEAELAQLAADIAALDQPAPIAKAA